MPFSWKKEKGLPVHDPVAERRKLEDITARAPEDMAVSILITVLILFLLYGGYYLVTCFSGREILRERK